MDLPLYLRVLWRFKLLVVIGLSLAVGLSFLSVVKVDMHGPKHFQYRQGLLWADDVTLLVAPQGFPWGAQSFGIWADPQKYASLATIYANLATSDEVKQIVLRDGHVDFFKEPMLSAVVPYSTQNSSSPPLPLITLEAQAATLERVIELAKRETKAFLQFLTTQQATNKIPDKQRVLVRVIKGDQVRLLKKRSKTTPVMIFMLVSMATLGLAFLLENLRPRVRAVPTEDIVLGPAEARRSA
jgi:hypothetical protein